MISALLPIGVLATVAYRNVARQLETQGRERLQGDSRALGQAIHERLTFLHAELANLAALASDPRRDGWNAPPTFGAALRDRLTGLTVVGTSGSVSPVFGEATGTLALEGVEQAQLADGGMVVRAGEPADLGRVLVAVGPGGGRWAPTILAVVTARYLWSGGYPEAALPAGVDVCVLDESVEVLDCSQAWSSATRDVLLDGIADRHAGDFAWADETGEYVAGFWSAGMHAYQPVSTTGAPQWRVVSSQRRAAVLAPVARFQRTFLLVVFLAITVVLFLSNVQIRRSTAPLDELREGTRRLAQRDFTTPVRVASGDEFETLADSFNTMSTQLDRQFRVLSAMNQLDRAVLQHLDRHTIVETVLSRGPEFLRCDALVVGMAEHDGDRSRWTLAAAEAGRREPAAAHVRPSSVDLATLQATPDAKVTPSAADLPAFAIGALTAHRYRTFLVLPLRVRKRVAGLIVGAYHADTALVGDDLTRARQLIDQMAVALASVRLFEQLQSLQIGALTALARTIDAKSPWTAGHSERVASGARLLARQLGHGEDDLEVIYRGSLLHDIGKIGISAAILDKTGQLTPDEMREMRSHPELGVRILAPIDAYSDVLPIVLSHHEKLSGEGYPAGLRGDEIPYFARIVAVVDVYDALTSERPYRAGWDRPAAIAHIRASAGTHFDPDVVNAFVQATGEDVMLGARSVELTFRLHGPSPAISTSRSG